MWAGQAAPLGEALPAEELTRKLAADALAILAGARVGALGHGDRPGSGLHRQLHLAGPRPGERRDRGRRSGRCRAGRSPKPKRRGWTIDQVWNTHWHPDHTGGNLAIKEATGARISGPAGEAIPGRDVALGEGDRSRHRQARRPSDRGARPHLGHIALIFDEERVAFVGDTLFAMGCGRLFEGTPSRCTPRSSSWPRCPRIPRLYCAHEYTLAECPLRRPRRARTTRRSPSGWLRSRRCARADEITLPTTVAQERETNPFVRATRLGRVRAAAGRTKTASVHEAEALDRSVAGREKEVRDG